MAINCRHCGRPGQAFVAARPSGIPEYNTSHIRWLWCTNCGEPRARDESDQIWPSAPFGPTVDGITDEGIRLVYEMEYMAEKHQPALE